MQSCNSLKLQQEYAVEDLHFEIYFFINATYVETLPL